MGKIIVGMGMSLDGFVNDSTGSVERLNPDFAEYVASPSFVAMVANTGAVIMGRHTYEMADPFMWANDDYEFQTPIFVLTHTPPEKYPEGNGKLGFTFVTDGIVSAVAQAKQAAGDKDVRVIGASTIQQCLQAGLCNELQVDIMPVILGSGLALFTDTAAAGLQLQRTKVEAVTAARTSITYSVTKTPPDTVQ